MSSVYNYSWVSLMFFKGIYEIIPRLLSNKIACRLLLSQRMDLSYLDDLFFIGLILIQSISIPFIGDLSRQSFIKLLVSSKQC